jgi:hypothetical protein
MLSVGARASRSSYGVYLTALSATRAAVHCLIKTDLRRPLRQPNKLWSPAVQELGVSTKRVEQHVFCRSQQTGSKRSP